MRVTSISGRPSVCLVQVRPRTRRGYAEIADLSSGRPDPDWAADHDQAWFWTPEWQAKEAEADEAAARGTRNGVLQRRGVPVLP